MKRKEIYGAGGNLYLAYRTVTKGGYIKFDGNDFQDDILKAYARERVEVKFAGHSPFAIGPVIVSELIIGLRICKIETYK